MTDQNKLPADLKAFLRERASNLDSSQDYDILLQKYLELQKTAHELLDENEKLKKQLNHYELF